ncbi:hypothetical protein K402DRAFT_390473 [Aulographum hederae CBS 113979]|uniref:SMP domain-containing protein n=1 Tax=Aulographum hederae CBS 113979 TaxID=1176131 RepID=A0A6G1HAC1_9PEZI|nr:hypothetical protein K402DRAFT_390473 [Aulographum hederae CBS 113979]
MFNTNARNSPNPTWDATSSTKIKMTKEDAARIQSSNAKSGADTGKLSFPARAQAAGDKNANAGQGQGEGGKK